MKDRIIGVDISFDSVKENVLCICYFVHHVLIELNLILDVILCFDPIFKVRWYKCILDKKPLCCQIECKNASGNNWLLV